MPSTRIETRKGWLGDRRLELIEAVQRALVAHLKIPESDRSVRLLEYEADSFIGTSEKVTEIEVTLFAGRSIEAKRNLYKGLVDELAAFGLAPNEIKVMLIEVPRENWGLRGMPGSEVQLGFKVEV